MGTEQAVTPSPAGVVAKLSVPTLTAMVVGSMSIAGTGMSHAISEPRRKETIIAGVATAYTSFLFDAAGLKFVLLMTVILAPATLLYIKARSERGRRLFTPAEIGLFVLILVGAAIGSIGLWTGRIAL